MYTPENCGILDNLVAGGLILADRGFNIHDSASLYCAEVKLPPFTEGKKSSRGSLLTIVKSVYTCRVSHRSCKAKVQNFTVKTTY